MHILRGLVAMAGYRLNNFFFGKTGTLGLDETFACGDV